MDKLTLSRTLAGSTSGCVLTGVLVLMMGSPQASAARSAETIVRYHVQNHDSLYRLGKQYFIRPTDYLYVQKLNGVTAPRKIPIGTVLRIPQHVLRTESVAAKVIAIRGDVSIADSNGIHGTNIGAEIAEGMGIETHAGAFATLELPDASLISLPPNSRIDIKLLRRTALTDVLERRFLLKEGRSDWEVTPSAKDPFSVTTPTATMAVRGTIFRVSYDGDTSTSTLSVLRGRVAVSGDRVTSETLVSAGSGTAVEGNNPIAPVDLLPAPDLQHPGANQRDVNLSFEVGDLSNAKAYEFEIASDAGFIDRIAEVETSQPRATFDGLPTGTYFVRTSAIDTEGVQGLESVYSFERNMNALRLESPLQGGSGGHGDYLFRWIGLGEGSATYEFVLSRDEAGQDRVVDEPQLSQTNITVRDLPDGIYYWRVSSMRWQDGHLQETVAQPQKVQIGNSSGQSGGSP
jgi:hypothetical protein